MNLFLTTIKHISIITKNMAYEIVLQLYYENILTLES